jgi:2-C-methyl-D-erythritol 4-phosphate cytidylyltransferase
MTIRYWAIVPAAGASRRFAAELPKQYALLNGQPVLSHTLQNLFSVAVLSAVVLVHAADDPYLHSIPEIHHQKLVTAIGGGERADSVLNGLLALQDLAADDDWVLVHDAARPCCSAEMMENLIERLSADAVGGLLAVPLHDTVKQVDSQQRITATIDRSLLWRAQTPQMFRYGALKKALQLAQEDRVIVTDEAQAIERMGLIALVVIGSEKNIKITRQDDLRLAEFYLQQEKEK